MIKMIIRAGIGALACLISLGLSGCGSVSSVDRPCGWSTEARSADAAMSVFLDGVRDKDVERICSVVTSNGSDTPTRAQIRDSLAAIHDSFGAISSNTFVFDLQSAQSLDYFYEVTLSYQHREVMQDTGELVKPQASFRVVSEGYRRLQEQSNKYGPDSSHVPQDFDGGPYLVEWDPYDFTHVTLAAETR